MSWLDKIVPSMSRIQRNDRRASVPDGLWRKCPNCESVLYLPELEKHQNVCPKCQHHLRLTARKRLNWFLDAEGREEISGDLQPSDRLKFRDSKKYKDRLASAQKATDENDALIAMRGTLDGLPIVAVAFEFSFMGGSMGAVVGEKFVRAATLALEEEVPLVCFAASGGARMQEALFSLMQMAKTSAALEKLKLAGVPYISVLTDPVFGGNWHAVEEYAVRIHAFPAHLRNFLDLCIVAIEFCVEQRQSVDRAIGLIDGRRSCDQHNLVGNLRRCRPNLLTVYEVSVPVAHRAG